MKKLKRMKRAASKLVFNLELPSQGERLDRLEQTASEDRRDRNGFQIRKAMEEHESTI